MDLAVLPLLLPITPNTVHDGVMLRNIRREVEGAIDLDFEYVAEGGLFQVRLSPARMGQRCFAAAGPIHLALDIAGAPKPHIDRYVRNLAAQIKNNTRGQTQLQIAALFSAVNPFLARWGAVPESKRVDLLVGHMCNEACVFCTDVRGRGRAFFKPAAVWQEKLAEMREKGAEQVLIVGNEPTLRADLPEILAAAKALGYRDIELSTNGVRLSDRAYFQELLDAGLNALSLSVHGYDAESEGINTGRPDLVKRRRQALENFATLVGDRQAQAARGVFLTSVTIFTRHNLPHIQKIVEYLDHYQCTFMKFHYPWIVGAAADNFAQVVPSYPDVLAAIEPIRERLQDPRQEVVVLNLPPCVPEGWRTNRTQSKAVVMPRAELVDGVGIMKSGLSVMDPTLVHAPECARCTLNQQCRGVPRRYLQQFGSAGLAPFLA